MSGEKRVRDCEEEGVGVPAEKKVHSTEVEGVKEWTSEEVESESEDESVEEVEEWTSEESESGSEEELVEEVESESEEESESEDDSDDDSSEDGNCNCEVCMLTKDVEDETPENFQIIVTMTHEFDSAGCRYGVKKASPKQLQMLLDADGRDGGCKKQQLVKRMLWIEKPETDLQKEMAFDRSDVVLLQWHQHFPYPVYHVTIHDS